MIVIIIIIIIIIITWYMSIAHGVGQ